MLPVYLILLLSAMGSIFISLRASHEITRLLGIGSAIFCLIFGFAMAPWLIKILICVFILSLERLYQVYLWKTASWETLPIFGQKRR
ncbi:MAG: hypothetical protein WA919_20100 [Coleofasciculaceae cyanobacterium]